MNSPLFTIGHLAKATGTKVETIRFYEKTGLLPKPARTEGNYPLDVMLLYVRWYVAYSRSLRDLEEMMAERAIGVDHSTVHRWGIKRRTRPILGFKDFDRTFPNTHSSTFCPRRK